jgi:hypothetical protein
MYSLLDHHRKEKQRSTLWQKNILLNILLGILGFILFLIVLGIGLSAEMILKEIYGNNADMTATFTMLLFYYFILDLLFRFFVQELPTMAILPYLTLPVKKSKLLHYLLTRSIFSFFNIIPFILILPFFFKVIFTSHTYVFSTAWLLTIIFLVATNNFLNFSLKKYFTVRPLMILILFAIAGASLYLDFLSGLSASGAFSMMVIYIGNNPLFLIIPVSLAIFAYAFAFSLLKKNSYIENKHSAIRKRTESFSFLANYGVVGDLVGVELKMILRNKRPRSVLYFSFFLLFYGLLLYRNYGIENYATLILAGFILTAAFSINYGQFLFSWEGSFFDSFIVNKISPINYLRSKYIIFSISGIVAFILTLPYGLLSYKIIAVNMAMLLFNTGVSSIVIILIATYNTSSIELGKSQLFNYQGTGMAQFLMIIPIIGLPMLVYLIFMLSGIPEYSLYALALIGIIAIIFNDFLLRLTVNQFLKKRYKMAIGFKHK